MPTNSVGDTSASIEKPAEDTPSEKKSDRQAPIQDMPDKQTLSEGMPNEEILYDLADLFKVFADTTRIKILYALMENDLCVADVAEAVGVSQSAVSHQLRQLRQARLVKFRRVGKQIIYGLSDNHVHTMLSQGMTHICE